MAFNGALKMLNRLIDLNNHLFAQMERLGDENLKYGELEKEICRSKAITDVATKIIDSIKVAVEMEKR